MRSLTHIFAHCFFVNNVFFFFFFFYLWLSLKVYISVVLIMCVLEFSSAEIISVPSVDVCLYLVGFEERGGLQSVSDFLQSG